MPELLILTYSLSYKVRLIYFFALFLYYYFHGVILVSPSLDEVAIAPSRKSDEGKPNKCYFICLIVMLHCGDLIGFLRAEPALCLLATCAEG